MELGDVALWMLVGAALVPAHRAAWQDGLPALVAVVLLDAIVVTFVGIAAADEKAWSRLAREDGVVEWATVAAFLGAGALHVALARRKWRHATPPPRLELAARAALALFCLFVAGEEISWGQRLFAFKPPDAFLERNYQQELNVHNVLMDEAGLGFALESKHVVAFLAIAFVVALPLFVRTRLLSGARAVAPPLALLPAGLVVFAAELSYPVDLTGEGAELLLGLLLLAAAVLEGFAPVSRVLLALLAPLAVGLVAAPLVARALYGDDARGSATALEELALLQQDVAGGAATAKLRKKGSVHKRVFTAARDEYLALSGAAFLGGRGTPAQAAGDARHDRRGYFLDPWNNPYWVVWDKKRHRVALYSFGPNRLRDTDVRESDVAAGDDLLVVFTLERTP
ncbi:MAG: hypothetical protein A2138_07375 [Deltaproteobacteria bacterium RBG_16_71_12]|nr:MAG: hypothetical protein A2138_07375 [Deltaproteobacteria bacterium RBG_16_71_12]